MHRLSVFERRLCSVLLLLAGLTLAFILVFTVFNVLMRAFGRPIVGDFEIISFLGAVVVGFSLPYTSMRKGHVAVDFMLEKLSPGSSCWVQCATRAVSAALFIWIGWNFWVMGIDLIKSGEVTPVFRLPYYPITFGLAFCCIVQSFVLLLQAREIAGGRNE